MSVEDLVAQTRAALFLLMWTAAPAVLTAALVGLVLAVIQTATQLQDQSVSQAIKLVAVVLVVLMCSGWIGSQVFRFSEQLFRDLPNIVRR
jgi:type III secretion protein S